MLRGGRLHDILLVEDTGIGTAFTIGWEFTYFLRDTTHRTNTLSFHTPKPEPRILQSVPNLQPRRCRFGGQPMHQFVLGPVTTRHNQVSARTHEFACDDGVLMTYMRVG
ncbi:hypothetical protein TMatcc_000627 [Talaromyces marneffei ATCC 18224]